MNISIGATTQWEEDERFFHRVVGSFLGVEELGVIYIAVLVTLHILTIAAASVDEENGMSNRTVEFANPHVGNRNTGSNYVGQGVVSVFKHLLGLPRNALGLNRLVVATGLQHLHDLFHIPASFPCGLRVTNEIVEFMGTKGTGSEHNFQRATVRLNLAFEGKLVEATCLEVPSVRVLEVGKSKSVEGEVVEKVCHDGSESRHGLDHLRHLGGEDVRVNGATSIISEGGLHRNKFGVIPHFTEASRHLFTNNPHRAEVVVGSIVLTNCGKGHRVIRALSVQLCLCLCPRLHG